MTGSKVPATLGDLKGYSDAMERALGMIVARLMDANATLSDRVAALEAAKSLPPAAPEKAVKPRVIIKADAKPRVVLRAP